MGEVIDFPGRADADLWVTKKQLARQVGYSTRWVEQRVADGLPSRMEGGRRMFPLRSSLEWIETYRRDQARRRKDRYVAALRPTDPAVEEDAPPVGEVPAPPPACA